MALLHVNVKQFDYPKKYLYDPARNLYLQPLLEKLIATDYFPKDLTDEKATLIAKLLSAISKEPKIYFLHSDVKDMNIICTRGEELLALNDWGDAGWGEKWER